MRILITGANGFLGTNLRQRLSESSGHEVLPITEESGPGELDAAILQTDFVFHLAGINRPKDPAEFETGNRDFTATLCAGLRSTGRKVPVVFTSSTQAALDNPYGRSKLAAEEILETFGRESGCPVHLFRLTNVFGKWSVPNYNSAVATFCHNIPRGLPITVNDPAAPLKLVYVDDVMDAFLAILADPGRPGGRCEAGPEYATTVGEVAGLVRDFHGGRTTLFAGRVGTGLARALHATYLSFLPPQDFAYRVPIHADPRGEFVEMLKTPDCGQFSYFTALPGITRGEHYHHTKTEKFLVIRGTARFQFRHILTGEVHETVVRGGEGTLIETVPGWTHNVTNIGADELIVMLWANEAFDHNRPDTIPLKVHP